MSRWDVTDDFYHVLACFRFGSILEVEGPRVRRAGTESVGERLHARTLSLFDQAMEVMDDAGMGIRLHRPDRGHHGRVAGLGYEMARAFSSLGRMSSSPRKLDGEAAAARSGETGGRVSHTPPGDGLGPVHRVRPNGGTTGAEWTCW